MRWVGGAGSEVARPSSTGSAVLSKHGATGLFPDALKRMLTIDSGFLSNNDGGGGGAGVGG